MVREGTEVEWSWGDGKATGTVKEIFKKDVSRTISGTKVNREASDTNPAYLIKQEDGQEVLKSSSEISQKS